MFVLAAKGESFCLLTFNHALICTLEHDLWPYSPFGGNNAPIFNWTINEGGVDVMQGSINQVIKLKRHIKTKQDYF